MYRIMTCVAVFAAAGVFLAAGSGADADEASTAGGEAKATPALDGAKLFKTKTCFTCHGPDGKTPILPNYPNIAGQNEEYVLQQMKDIKSGARNNGQTAAMKGIMHLVNDAEIEALAKYVSTLEP